MALSFAIDPSKGETFDATQRRRAHADAIARSLMGGRSQSVGDGLGSVGRAIIYRSLMGKADAAEKAGTEGATSVFNNIAAALSGQGGEQASAPADYPSQRVAQAHASNLSGDNEAFIATLMPAAIEASQRTGVDPRIIVAQAAQETGWGKSAPGNNYFGIKSHGKAGGQNLTTHEVIKGNRVKVNDSFRTFGSPADSVSGYADFLLENPRYKPMMAAQGLDAQLQALGASGYATDPNYAASVGSIARGIPMPDMGGAGAPVEVASLDPSAGMGAPPVERAPLDAVDVTASTPGPVQPMSMLQPPRADTPAQSFIPRDTVPPLDPPREVATLPIAAAPPQAPQDMPPPQVLPQVAQNAGPSIQMLMEAAQNPWLNESQRSIVNMLLQQKMQEQDPMRQLQMQKLQKEISGAGAGDFKVVGDQLVRIGPDGAISDVTPAGAQGAATGAFRFGGKSVEAQALNGLMDSGQLTPEQAQQLGAGKTITGPNGEILFMTPQGVFGQPANGGPAQPVSMAGGDSLGSSDAPQTQGGNIQLTEPKVTVDEKKAMTFADRMATSGAIINQIGGVGAEFGQALLGQVPFVGNKLVSEEYQKYDQARRDFINAQLRRESGAVISPEEFDNANKQYFPQPGDGPEVLAQKEKNRRIAIEGMVRDSGPTYRPPQMGASTDEPDFSTMSDEELERLINGQ